MPEKSPSNRPRLHAWRREQKLTLDQAGPRFEVSRETFRRWCLPFGHADRRTPDDQQLARSVAVTARAITGEDFIDPKLRKAAA